MKRLKGNQTGFGALVPILIIIIIGLIGAVGWLVYQNQHKTTTKAVVVKAKTTKPATKATAQNTLKIPELKIQLVNIPESIKDLTYTTSPGTDNAYTAVSFDTKTLAGMCGGTGWIGTVNVYPGTYSKDKMSADPDPIIFVKQLNDQWVGLLNIGGVICKDDSTTVSFQGSQINTFKQFATNPANWQAY